MNAPTVRSVALAALVLGCSGGPPAGSFGSLRLVRATETPAGLEVEWRLLQPSMDGDGPVTRSSGQITLVLEERNAHAIDDAVQVVCRAAPQPVTTESFSRERDWSAVTTFVFAPPCPPPPSDPALSRVLHLEFRDPLDYAEANADPPPSWRTPTTLLAWVTESERYIQEQRALATSGAAAEQAAARAAALERIRAYQRTLVPLIPLIPSTPPTEPQGCGTDLPGTPVPLIDFEELQRSDGSFGDRRLDSLTHRRFVLMVDAEISPPDLIIAEASEIDESLRWIWVRRTTSRTEGSLVPPSGTIPTQYNPGTYRGGLYLLDRTASRLVCGAPIEASNSDEISGRATAQAAANVLSEGLRRDLDARIIAAVYDARARLTGGALPFEPDER